MKKLVCVLVLVVLLVLSVGGIVFADPWGNPGSESC